METNGTNTVLKQLTNGNSVNDVLSKTSDKPHTFENGDPVTDAKNPQEFTDTETCQQCGESFKKIAGHWCRSSTCDYPNPTPEEGKALLGLWLAGGVLTDESSGDKCRLTFLHDDPDALEVVNEKLGRWSGSVAERTHGTATRWQIDTRRNPWIAKFDNREMESANLFPETASVLFELCGNINDGYAHIKHDDAPVLASLFRDAGFACSVASPTDCTPRIRFSREVTDELRSWMA